MCIAIVKQRNVKLPDYTVFSNCFSNNPHGAGFVVNKDGRYNCIYKGFDNIDEFYEKCLNEIKICDSAILHFRFATHGKIDQRNCHPFFCSNDYAVNSITKNGMIFDCKAMVHNGVLNIHKNGTNSDSFEFSKLLANDKNKIDHNKMIETNNKIAILNIDGTIELYGNWYMDMQLIFSNGTYKTDCNLESKKKNINYSLCDCCGNIGENYIDTDVGYHFCKYCSDVVVHWHKCKLCGKNTTDFICNECFEKNNFKENYFIEV